MASFLSNFYVILFVACSVLQSVAFYCCAALLNAKALFLTFVVYSFISLPIFGVFIMMAQSRGGFLVEVGSKRLFHSFVTIGLLTAIYNWARSYSFLQMPVTLEITLSQSVIPIIVCIMLSCNIHFAQIFSKREIIGSILIGIGVLAHVCTIYYTIPEHPQRKSIAVDTLWWIVLQFFSIIPVAMSAIHQQDVLSTVRLNVIYMLYRTTMVQLIASILLLPLNFALEITVQDIDSVVKGFKELYACLVWEDGQNVYCQYLYIPFIIFIISSAASQILQAVFIRHVHYRHAMLAIMSIPFFIFAAAVVCKLAAPTDILFDRIYISNLTSEYILMDILCFVVVYYGVFLYRINDDGILSAAYAFHPQPIHELAVNKTEVFSQNLSGIQENAEEDDETSVQFTNDMKSRYATSSERPRRKSIHPSIASHLKVNPLLLPRHPHNVSTELPIIAPVVMNLWSGAIACEYTDYKRNFDMSLVTSMREINGHRHPMEGDEPSSYIWDQYTTLHVAGLGNIEESLRQLYAYHRMGTNSAPVPSFDIISRCLTPSASRVGETRFIEMENPLLE